MLTFKSNVWRFDRGSIQSTLSPVSIGDVFLEAAFHLTDRPYHEKLLSTTTFWSRPGMLRSCRAHGTPIDDAQVLDLVDERNTAGEIVAASPSRKIELCGFSRRPPGGSSPAAKAREGQSSSSDPRRLRSQRSIRSMAYFVFNDMQCQNHWQVLG
jgi:hypothetical protein